MLGQYDLTKGPFAYGFQHIIISFFKQFPHILKFFLLHFELIIIFKIVKRKKIIYLMNLSKINVFN
jgi:hypothetical protein